MKVKQNKNDKVNSANKLYITGANNTRGALEFETTVRSAQNLFLKIRPLKCSKKMANFTKRKITLQCTNKKLFYLASC